MTEKEFDTIENYMLGRLDGEERIAFQQRIDLDPEFRDEVAVFSDVQNVIKQYGRIELRKKIFPPSRIPFMIQLPTWAVVLATALLLVVTAYLIKQPSHRDLLFREFYSKIDTIHFAAPGDDSDSYQIKMDAYHAYRSDRHKEAADHLDKLAESDAESELIAGLNLLHQGSYEEAKSKLLIAKTGQSKVSAAASWYLALIYVKQKQNPKAIEELQPLTQSDNPYKDKATELLTKIK